MLKMIKIITRGYTLKYYIQNYKKIKKIKKQQKGIRDITKQTCCCGPTESKKQGNNKVKYIKKYKIP